MTSRAVEMTMHFCKRILPVALLTLMSVTLVGAQAFGADTKWHEVMTRANTAYNDGQYERAQELYIRAIQSEPSRASTYRNLARAYFWQDSYAAAVHYYDHYLTMEPGADDEEAIRSERRLAASRASDEPWTPSEAQRLSRQALDRELNSGRAFTDGGGGAWALYETLIRSGYAQPDLAQVRARLTRAIMNEFDAAVMPESGDLVPRLSLEEWQTQAQRLDAARQVTTESSVREMIERRSALVETGIAILNNPSEQTAELARLARVKNPDLGFVSWYEIVAMAESDQLEASLIALTEFARELHQEHPEHLDHLKVLRAIILQRDGRKEDAAGIFRDLLIRE